MAHVTIVDLDRDGLPDVLACDALRNRVSWIRQFPKGTFTETTIAEIPAPACVGARSPFLPAIRTVRRAFAARFHPTAFWQRPRVRVHVAGTPEQCRRALSRQGPATTIRVPLLFHLARASNTIAACCSELSSSACIN